MTPIASRHGAGYLVNAFDSNTLIRLAIPILADKDFDTVVGTGVSGTIGATLLAHALNKNLLIVRKDKDNSHSYFPPDKPRVEGYLGKRWVFVDDLIGGGATRKRCLNAVSLADPSAAYVGTYTYGDNFGTPPQWRVDP